MLVGNSLPVWIFDSCACGTIFTTR